MARRWLIKLCHMIAVDLVAGKRRHLIKNRATWSIWDTSGAMAAVLRRRKNTAHAAYLGYQARLQTNSRFSVELEGGMVPEEMSRDVLLPTACLLSSETSDEKAAALPLAVDAAVAVFL